MEPNDTNNGPREETSDDIMKSALAAQTKQSSASTAMIAVVAVVVVVLALMYVWASNTPAPVVLPPPPVVQTPPVAEIPVALPPEESVESIEMDLGMPEIESLDAEITILEADLEAALAE